MPFGDGTIPLQPMLFIRTIYYDADLVPFANSGDTRTLPDHIGDAEHKAVVPFHSFVITSPKVAFAEFKADVRAPLEILVEDANGRDVLKASADVLSAVSQIVSTFAKRWDEIAPEDASE